MRYFFFFQAEDGIRDYKVTGVQTCALPIFFPANSSPDTAEYLLVPQATTGSPDLSTSFMLAGSAAAAAAPALAVGAQVMPSPRSPAGRFHDRLRELERTRAYGGGAGRPPPLPPPPPRPPTP